MAYHAAGRTWLDSDGMHLAHSADGYDWEPLHGNQRCKPALETLEFGTSLFLAPEVGRCRFLENARAFSPKAEKGRRAWAPFKALLENATFCGRFVLRDPFVFLHPPSSRYHALWTTGWASPVIGRASSTDLVSWSAQREIDVTRGLDAPINAWAPEAAYDKRSGKTVIFWSTAQGAAWTRPTDIKRSTHAVYHVTAKGAAFDSFSAAKPLLPPPPAGPSAIDASMAPFLPSEKAWFLVFKLEVNKTLAVASAPAIDGPFKIIATNIAPDAGAVEGPSVVRRSRDEVVIYFDRYEAGSYGAVRAKSMWGPWEDVSSSLSMPKGARHATVLRVPKATVQRLRASFGTRDRGLWRPDGVSRRR
jgi:hypothetical protein